jgi:ferredoxin like protein
MKTDTERKLGTLRYKIDKEAHIQVNSDICKECTTRACISSCPAECFTLQDGKVHYQFEDCIECGTCKLICPKGAIQWNYPRGTFGVAFRYG